MEEALALIEKIIEEHKVILEKIETLEQVANDASALLTLDKAKEAFMPGRFDRAKGLKKLDEWLNIITQGLQAHFQREETALLAAFEKHGGRPLVAALHSLLREHENLRERFAQCKKQIDELSSGRLSRQVWEANAYDMRAYISHSRKLIEAHAENEQKLLFELRGQLKRNKVG